MQYGMFPHRQAQVLEVWSPAGGPFEKVLKAEAVGGLPGQSRSLIGMPLWTKLVPSPALALSLSILR